MVFDAGSVVVETGSISLDVVVSDPEDEVTAALEDVVLKTGAIVLEIGVVEGTSDVIVLDSDGEATAVLEVMVLDAGSMVVEVGPLEGMVPVELSKLAESVVVLKAEKDATLLELSIEVLAVEAVEGISDVVVLDSNGEVTAILEVMGLTPAL